MTKQTTKLALFLSTLAIILIVLLMMHFKGLALFSKANASELSYEEAIAEIYDYIDSRDGFTDEQKDALNSAITNYLKECDYLTTQDLTNIYELIDRKYDSNHECIENIRNELVAQLNNTSNADNKKFEEINSLINDLNSWLEKTNDKEDETRKSFSEVIQELRAYTDSENKTMTENFNKNLAILTDQLIDTSFNLKSLINELNNALKKENKSINNRIDEQADSLKNETNNLNNKISEQSDSFAKENNLIRDGINNLSDTVKSNNDDIWEAIEKLNERTTDNDGQDEFNFKYQDGCYGYEIDGQGFQPF